MSLWKLGTHGLLLNSEGCKVVQFAPPANTNRLWLGLGGPYDYSRELVIVDVFKTARQWLGHLPDQWGGGDEYIGELDSNGYPLTLAPELESFGTLILVEQGEGAAPYLAGRYALTYDGEGTVVLNGAATNVVTNANRIEFDYTPTDSNSVVINVQSTTEGNHIRNMSCCLLEHEAQVALGDYVRADYPWSNVKLMRFMDKLMTNFSELTSWSGRPRMEHYSWALNGWPVEMVIQLANAFNVDPYVCMPHQADDNYIEQFALAVREGLNPGLTCYVEWSNETWNWIFDQTHWCVAQAEALGWGTGGDQWIQYSGVRSAQCMDIWSTVFAGQMQRIRRVIGVQAGWTGLAEPQLTAPLWTALGNPAPYLSFDAYGVTGYFDGGLSNGAGAAALKTFVENNTLEDALAYAEAQCLNPAVDGSIPFWEGLWTWHKNNAATYGLDMVMYEGGTHIVANGDHYQDPVLVPFFNTLNYSENMGRLYRSLMRTWDSVNPEYPFNQFTGTEVASVHGCWGASRWLGDTNPREAVVREYNLGPLAP